MKICTKCKVEKDDTQFALKKNKSGSISIRSTCRRCILDKHKERYKTESLEAREARVSQQNKWRAENNDKVKALKAKYRLNAKTIKLSSIPHDAHVKCRDRFINKQDSISFDNHVKEWKANKTIYARWLQRHDMSYVVYQRLKRGVQRLFRSLKIDRTGWLGLLGYTRHDLKRHIEKQFTYGMGWDNRDQWHIDHIKPLCSYDIKSINDYGFKECFSLDNLRPLWAGHNRIKYHTHDKHMSGKNP